LNESTPRVVASAGHNPGASVVPTICGRMSFSFLKFSLLTCSL
jgi:hypothetical protein